MNRSTVRNAVSPRKSFYMLLSLQIAFCVLMAGMLLFFGLLVLELDWAFTGQIHAISVISTGTLILMLLPIPAGLLAGSGLGILIRWFQDRRLMALLGGVEAQAWSHASLQNGSWWSQGGMWLVGDRLYFRANGVHWKTEEGNFKVLTDDHAGWLRVLNPVA